MGTDAERIEPAGLMRRLRIQRVTGAALLFLALGSLYGIFVQRTGIAIPCLFRFVTGYLCPGCGVTHMCMALLQLDFKTAYASHPMLFILLPFLAVTVGKYILDYINRGIWSMNRLQMGTLYISAVLLIVYNIIRNF